MGFSFCIIIGGTSQFDCGNGVLIDLNMLCNGVDDCASGARPGDDETAVICDSKLMVDAHARLHMHN